MLMHPKYMFTLAALLLSVACAPTVVGGDAKGGVVENRSGLGVGIVGVEIGTFSERARQAGLEQADRHCAQFGKRARIVVRNNAAQQFECVGADGSSAAPKS